MKILIIPNKTREGTEEVRKQVEKVLDEKGVGYEELELKEEGDYKRAKGKECDLVLYIGGDGTMLRAAKASLETLSPISGINTGNVGYRVGMKAENWREDLCRIISNEYESEDCVVIKAGNRVCVNEAVIYSKELKEYRVYKGNELIYESRSSGIIVATPIGSSGLNRSAGGAVMEKTLGLVEITPICPYSGETNSMVVSANEEYTIKFEGKAMLRCDGELDEEVISEVKIRKKEDLLKFVKTKK